MDITSPSPDHWSLRGYAFISFLNACRFWRLMFLPATIKRSSFFVVKIASRKLLSARFFPPAKGPAALLRLLVSLHAFTHLLKSVQLSQGVAAL